MTFNVNNYVAVQLTEYGKQLLKRDHDEFYAKWPTPNAPEFKIEENWDGWSKWQLWDLMFKLGPHMYNGCKVPFKAEIKLLSTIDD